MNDTYNVKVFDGRIDEIAIWKGRTLTATEASILILLGYVR